MIYFVAQFIQLYLHILQYEKYKTFVFYIFQDGQFSLEKSAVGGIML